MPVSGRTPALPIPQRRMRDGPCILLITSNWVIGGAGHDVSEMEQATPHSNERWRCARQAPGLAFSGMQRDSCLSVFRSVVRI